MAGSGTFDRGVLATWPLWNAGMAGPGTELAGQPKVFVPAEIGKGV